MLVKPKPCEKQAHFKVFHSLQDTMLLLVSPEIVDLSPQWYTQIALSGQSPVASFSYCIPLCINSIYHVG